MIPKAALVGVLLLFSVSMGTVAAQESGSTVQVETGESEQVTCEVIDSDTSLCDATLENGSAVLTLQSDVNQRITFTDAGAFVAGGVVETQTPTVTER
jgi:hypothetical protein